MKIIEPKVELWSEENVSPESHIAHCARVCYGKEYKEPDQEADEKMVNGLIKRGHLSMLRHSSVYYGFLPSDMIPTIFMSEYVNSIANSKGYVWASTNRQFAKERKVLDVVGNCSPSEFLENFCIDNPLLFKLFRLTFCITTQIATSSELNRVSPNNIAERSTRYCSSKDGLEICKPWWYDNTEYNEEANIRAYSVWGWRHAESTYKFCLQLGMKPEDARGILPLDTATKVIYTYSVQEWQHILDLSLYD